ncbi:MAG: HAMP domain-containing histidine kinase [Lachnospiraceae bacterium]|nr:HAMP domain-containing histidine kinase [Lachnospiraceae bacterium]
MNKNKSNITNKVLYMAAVSMILVTAVFLVIYVGYKKDYEEALERANNGKIIVALNEVDRLLIDEDNTGFYKDSQVKDNIDSLIVDLQDDVTATYKNDLKYITIFYITSMFAIIIIYFVIYIMVLRPFKKLENFAAEIAEGNLDKDLKYERVNVFGEFTWAFDHMRREIKKARQCEQEAVENNKTVIATLSHDIKTPIASIRAYSEALAENMDSTPERRGRYIDVITKKCDEVTKITNDMFIHSLHDLDKLVIKKEDVNIHEVINETVEAMEGSSTDIILGQVKECCLKGDAGRIAQVIENLINNARKYAKGNIYINTEITDMAAGQNDTSCSDYIITVKDEGKGIPPEDMPFIFDKFYRGKNHGEEPGAGLGLFIVKYVMEQMDGRVELVNESDGLLVKLFFKP